jgi:copper chaperone CopZ
VNEIAVRVPGITSRRCVRAISKHVGDVAGVRTIEVDPQTKTVRVTGDVDADAVCDAITAAGFDITE